MSKKFLLCLIVTLLISQSSLLVVKAKEAPITGLLISSDYFTKWNDRRFNFSWVYVGEIIKSLLTSGPEAIAACKKLIYDISNKMTFEDAIDYTARTIAELRASDEGQEGMASFLEKRKPRWVIE